MRIDRWSRFGICSLVVLTAGCRETATQIGAQQTPQPRQSVAMLGSDTLTLSYVCGNNFRIKRYGAASTDTTIRWHAGVADSGAVPLYRKLRGHQYTEAIVHATSADTLSIDGLSSLKEANTGASNCVVPLDTSWVEAATFAELYSYRDGSIKLAGSTAEDSVYARAVEINPADGVSRDSIAHVLATFSLRVVGKARGRTLIVRVDDLRATKSRYDQLIDSLRMHAAIRTASPATVNTRTIVTPAGRYPVDAAPFTRANWIARAADLWPYLNTRLDLAWSCETGDYGDNAPPIVFLEAMPLSSHSDLNSSRIHTHQFSLLGMPSLYKPTLVSTADSNWTSAHALAVTGTALATGGDSIRNNRRGVARIWRCHSSQSAHCRALL